MLAGNTAERTRLIWGPAGSKYQAFKEAPYKDDFDEWLARIVCYAFSLPPTAFTRQVNRATAETSQEAVLDEGLAPLMGWVKRLCDGVIQHRMGQADLEFAWSQTRALDPKDEAAILEIYVKEGIKTRNEARALLGDDPLPGGDLLMVDTTQGPLPLVPAAAPAPVAKVGFNPDEPRVPAGNPGGGQWTSGGGASAQSDHAPHAAPILVASGTGPPGIGHNAGPPLEEPPQIPPTEPATKPETNSFIKRAAQWLKRALAFGSLVPMPPAVRAFLRALQTTAWIADYLPYITSYLDDSKSLEELQSAVDEPRRGYGIHHIVEVQAGSTNPKANSKVFSKKQLEGRDNLVRIPYWKHREISGWYSRPNSRYRGLTPREHLRGKSWDEQYEFGLDQLRNFGVLK